MTRIRPIAPTDIELICRHRAEMFAEAGRTAAAISEMAEPFQTWLRPRLEDGRYFGFIAKLDGRAVGGVGLMELDWPPHPSHPSDDRRGYVLNVFVEPVHRGKGIARRLMQAADEEFARRQLGYVVLHATSAGRPLYDRLGWLGTSEMAKQIR